VTLVVFVRCQDGCVLVGDRKATDHLGYGEEESKLKVFSRGWAMGGAGDLDPIRKLFSKLDEEDVTLDSLEQIIAETFREYCNLQDAEVSCILLKAQNQSVEAEIIEASSTTGDSGKRAVGLTPPIPIGSPFKCIGEVPGKIVASHYLKKKDYGAMACEQAAPEILAIMKQASKEGSYVGRQEEFGFDVLLVKNGTYSLRPRETTEYVILTSEYSFVNGVSAQFNYTQFENGGV